MENTFKTIARTNYFHTCSAVDKSDLVFIKRHGITSDTVLSIEFYKTEKEPDHFSINTSINTYK